jgi:AcrR family transcriptional regulator
MARRNDHSREQLQEMALLASESIISHEGVGALSTRKVATEIGYSAGTLYQVFNNFDDLIMQLNSRTLARLQSQLINAKTPVAIASLKAYGFCYLNFAQQQPALWQLIFEHRPANPDLRPDQLLFNIDSLFALVTNELLQLKPNAPKSDITIAAHSLWSGVHGITVLMLKDKLFNTHNHSAQDTLNCLMDNFILGWTAQGEPHA